MNRHLSEQQFAECLIGHRSAEVESHLRSCQECADEVARAAEPLTLFGGAVRSWGEEQMGPVLPRLVATPAPVWRWRLALAMATLSLLVAVPVYRHRQEAAVTAVQAAQDEILLRQVEQKIAQSVPAPMEPLAKLMPNDLTR